MCDSCLNFDTTGLDKGRMTISIFFTNSFSIEFTARLLSSWPDSFASCLYTLAGHKSHGCFYRKCLMREKSKTSKFVGFSQTETKYIPIQDGKFLTSKRVSTIRFRLGSLGVTFLVVFKGKTHSLTETCGSRCCFRSGTFVSSMFNVRFLKVVVNCEKKAHAKKLELQVQIQRESFFLFFFSFWSCSFSETYASDRDICSFSFILGFVTTTSIFETTLPN